MGSGRAGFALRRFASGSFDTAIEVDRAHMSSKHQLKSPFFWGGLLNKSWAVQLHSLHSGRVCYSLLLYIGVSEVTWSVNQMRRQRELKNPFSFVHEGEAKK